MTEDLPLAATTVKGRTRAAMTSDLLAAAGAGRVRVAIGRASDFFGPGVIESTLGQRVKLAVRALGLVSPMMRALGEMSYEFEAPFVLDTTKYQSVFGSAGTPLAAAIAATMAWYRTRTDAP